MNIQEEIRSLKEHSLTLGKSIKSIEDFINNGDEHTLPLRIISSTLENLKETSDKHTKLIEVQQIYISKINSESLKARNQIVWMFLTILATIVGKFFVQYLIG